MKIEMHGSYWYPFGLPRVFGFAPCLPHFQVVRSGFNAIANQLPHVTLVTTYLPYFSSLWERRSPCAISSLTSGAPFHNMPPPYSARTSSRLRSCHRFYNTISPPIPMTPCWQYLALLLPLWSGCPVWFAFRTSFCRIWNGRMNTGIKGPS